MSRVNNFTVLATITNSPALDSLNATLRLCGEEQEFERMEQSAGGSKHLEHVVFGMAGNYVQFSLVRNAMLSVQWPDPDGVVLVYLGQEDMRFAVFDFAALRASASEA